VNPARAWWQARAARGVRLDLRPMRLLAEALGHPELAAPVLLVAGTNGKGSVVAYVEAALRASGLRTGRFTSPALLQAEEQIAVDGMALAPRDFDAALAQVRAAACDARVEPSSFEALAAAAYTHFRRAAVDVAVVEVGMGGTDDATNVAEPLASAIVSIALDHESFLGTSLASIARAKAGVMRAGRATVVGPLPHEARPVIARAAAQAGARLVDAAADTRLEQGAGGLCVQTPTRVLRGLRALPGRHQHDNLRVAVRLLEAGQSAGLPVDFEALPQALDAVAWPGRLQWLDTRPPLLLDGAHNPAGARALADDLRGRAPHVLVFGAMRDKDAAGMAAELFPAARAVVLTRADASARAADPAELLALAPAAAPEPRVEPDLERALALARRLAGESSPEAFVVVAGSLALVGAVLARSRAG
jgi:dihydrofolate synthase/folylpolyglutamate synthase